MPNSARHLFASLRDSPEASSLLERVELARKTGRLLAPLAESLAIGFDPTLPGRCELRDEILRLTVDSPAQAAKLRQAAPRFLSALRSQGIQVYEMRTQVQPVDTSYPGQGTAPPSTPGEGFPPINPETADRVTRAALSIHNGTLASALERLGLTLKRHGRRLTR
jgi:hypothetical protein